MSSATGMTDCMWRKKKKEAREDEEDYKQDKTSEPSMPKTILELMNVHGLTHENVASHLQVWTIS
jgi:hypothetical protein